MVSVVAAMPTRYFLKPVYDSAVHILPIAVVIVTVILSAVMSVAVTVACGSRGDYVGDECVHFHRGRPGQL